MGSSARKIKARQEVDETVWAPETTAEDVVLAEFADETAVLHPGSPKVVSIASYLEHLQRVREWRLFDPRTPLREVARMICVGSLSAMALGASFAIGFGYIWSDRGASQSTIEAPGDATARPYLDSWWPLTSSATNTPEMTSAAKPPIVEAKPPVREVASGSPAAPVAHTSVHAPVIGDTTPSVPTVEPSTEDAVEEVSVLPSEPMVLAESAPSTPPPAASVERVDSDGVRRVIEQYEQAYSQKDLGALAMVWPTIDTDGVARAFAAVDEQALTLNDCRVTTSGDVATAVCPGSVRYVGRVGPRRVQERDATWTIALERRGESWQFVRLSVR